MYHETERPIRELGQSVREKEIPDMLGNLQSNITRIEDHLSTLENDLVPVLSPEAPENGKVNAVERTPGTALGASLREMNFRLERIQQRFVSIASRLEL